MRKRDVSKKEAKMRGLLNRLYLKLLIKLSVRFFGYCQTFTPNGVVKAIHFGVTEEDFKQSVIDIYFNQIRSENV